MDMIVEMNVFLFLATIFCMYALGIWFGIRMTEKRYKK